MPLTIESFTDRKMDTKLAVRNLLNSRSPSPGYSIAAMPFQSSSSSSSPPPPHGSKHHRFPTNLFGFGADRTSPPVATVPSTTPRNLPVQPQNQTNYDYQLPTTPNNYPSSTVMMNQISGSSLSSPPNPYDTSYSGSVGSPLSSLHDDAKISSHTTPSYDPDFPFDISGNAPMTDFNIDEGDDFANSNSLGQTPIAPYDAVKRTTTNSSRGTHLPSPDSTDAATPSPHFAPRKLGTPVQFDSHSQRNYQSLDSITSPSFTVEDHDEVEKRRTRIRMGDGEASLNRVASSSDPVESQPSDRRGNLPGEDGEIIMSLQDMELLAQHGERISLVESWLTRSQSPGESIVGESGRLSNRERNRLGVDGESHHKRSRSVGDWRKVGPMHAATHMPSEDSHQDPHQDPIFHHEDAQEFPFEELSPRASGDVLHDGTSDEDENMSEEESGSDLGDVVVPDQEYAFLAPDMDGSAVDEDEFSDLLEAPKRVDTGTGAMHEEGMDDLNDLASASKYPNSRGFYQANAKLWTDPPNHTNHYDATHNISRAQPATANAAIERLRLAADKFETASRVATFGSIATQRRRLSAGDIEALPGIFKRMSFGRDKETLSVPQRTKADDQERKPSIFEYKNEVKNVLKRFASAGSDHHRPVFGSTSMGSHGGSSNSFGASSSSTTTLKDSSIPSRKESQKSAGTSSSQPSRKFPSIHRKLSKKSKKDKELKLDTKSAFAGMMGPLMSVGGGEGGASAASTIGTNSVMTSPSRSQRYGSSGSRLGSVDVKFGQPSMPARRHDSQGSLRVPRPRVDHSEDDLSDADAPGDFEMPPPPLPVKQTLDPITQPSKQGFSRNCQQMFPTLLPRLNDRIASEQVKKFKRLQENFVKHEALVRQNGHCSNGDQCSAVTGQGRETSKMTFSVGAGNLPTNAMDEFGEESDDDLGESFNNGDGKVSAAQFPFGVPVPPTTRLPAEFECPICFKMKRFTKPSDWTKHVHEDVMPFTCTFPECTEPKSFKRKADWVRHENEKHRHLEWWKCNIEDCTHICFRKDNFVQHLVREHKLPEVKVKAGKGATKGKKAQGKKAPEDDPSEDDMTKVWKIVADCHHETDKEGKDEPCRFCGDSQPTWKKLTVHIARHMERISLPVLTLVGENALMSPLSAKAGNISTKTSPISGPFSAGGYGLATPTASMSLNETLVYRSNNVVSPINNGMMLPSQIPMGANGVDYYQQPGMQNSVMYQNIDPVSGIHALYNQFPPADMMRHSQNEMTFSSISETVMHGSNPILEQQVLAETQDYAQFLAREQAAQDQQHHGQGYMGNEFDTMQMNTQHGYPTVGADMSWGLPGEQEDEKYFDYSAAQQQHQQQHPRHY